MKKIFTLVVAVALAGAVSGQDKTQDAHLLKPRALTSIEERISLEQGQLQIPHTRGGEFFCEDFSNGLDGTTSYGAWTTEDTGTEPIWMMATAASPGGEFSNTDQALQSTSADNGWVIFDCDLYNTPISAGFEDVTGFLTSPVIDMSNLNTVVVEWSQVFRYCCFSASPLTVEVTVDGGTTWTVFDGHGEFIQAANVISANPLVSQLDISCVAANEPAVQIRWAYNSAGATGYSHYFWGIDDICIFENPTVDDIEVTQVTNGDIFNIWEYRVTPLEQATTQPDGGLLVGTIYRNIGATDLADVTITVEILTEDESAVLSTTVSDPFALPSFGNQPVCPPNLTDTLYLQTEWVPASTGTYVVRTTVQADGVTDATPENNTIQKTIVYTDDEYGHSDPEQLDLEIFPRESDNSTTQLPLVDPTGHASFFTCPNEGSTAYGVLAKFGPGSDPGVEFEARLYKGNDAAPFDPNQADIFGFQFFLLTEEFTEDSENDWFYLAFEDPIELDATDVAGEVFNNYFVGVINEFESEGDLTILAQPDSDTDNSTLQYEITGDGDFVWFTSQTHTPAIRMVVSEREPWVSVEELAAATDVEVGICSPNPAVGITRIPLTLNGSHNVALEIRDQSGKLVKYQNFRHMPAGDHTLEVDVQELAAGTYTYAVIAGTERVARQMIVAGK